MSFFGGWSANPATNPQLFFSFMTLLLVKWRISLFYIWGCIVSKRFLICNIFPIVSLVFRDEEGEDNLRKRNLRLPFHFATGEALLYDTGFLRSLSDAGLGGAVPSGEGSLDPDSLLGAMLRQDDSIYVCLPGQEQSCLQSGRLPSPAGDAGSIFHSDWNQNHVIFPESTVAEPDGRSEEDKNGDLWTLMSSLGVCSEDLELLQRDETFFKEDTPGDGDIADVADEILAYIGESLTIQSDCVLAGDYGMAACVTQCQKPHSPLRQRRQEQPPDPPRCPTAPERQDTSLEAWGRGRAAEQQDLHTPCAQHHPHVCKHPQLLMHRDHLLADCPHQQLHHSLSHVQVSRDPPSSVAMDTMNGHPSSFKLDQPHLQMLPPPLYGCFIVEGPPTELHGQDGGGSDPDGHLQGLFSARLPKSPAVPGSVPEDHFPALDLEELLEIPELGGVGGEVCVTDNQPPVSQCVSVAELPGLGESTVPLQAHLQVWSVSVECVCGVCLWSVCVFAVLLVNFHVYLRFRVATVTWTCFSRTPACCPPSTSRGSRCTSFHA